MNLRQAQKTRCISFLVSKLVITFHYDKNGMLLILLEKGDPKRPPLFFYCNILELQLIFNSFQEVIY